MKTNGQKLTQKNLYQPETRQKDLTQGILAPLAFFSLYSMPLSVERIHELLFQVKASREEVESNIRRLVSENKIIEQDGLFGIKPWYQERLRVNQKEIEKRWNKIKKYYFLLSIIPFIQHVSVIHSMALGNVDQESDIDFLVVTKPGRLYFVRSTIIVLFKILGVYKTRTKVKEQFCFGYYITTDNLDLGKQEGVDDFLAFWFAAHIPILGQHVHQDFLAANSWINEYFPQYQGKRVAPQELKSGFIARALKAILEVLLFIPTQILEPLFARIHIRHTFNLPENHWPTSLTVANKQMLKLHAVSQRGQINEAFRKVLQRLS